MSAIILPYTTASRSARALAEALHIRRMRVDGSTRRDDPSLTIINWGNTCTDLSRFTEATVLNKDIRPASNKLAFFRLMLEWNLLSEDDAVNIPEFTTDNEVAAGWLRNGKKVVARHILAGNSGEGIQLLEGDVEVPHAPLYTQYVKKRDEYRVHVVKGVVTDVQRKARSTSTSDDDVNWAIRNLDGGFIFARENVNPDPSVMEQAKLAMAASGLDFGAVDIIWNARQRKAYVLEINTACGLEGTTLERYAAAFTAVLAGEEPQEVDLSISEVEATVEPVEASEEPRGFEVGDRVIVSSNMPSIHGPGPGVTGSMVELRGDGAILTIENINSQGEIYTGNWYWLPEWLEHAPEAEEDVTEVAEEPPIDSSETEPAFSVGDRVIVTTINTNSSIGVTSEMESAVETGAVLDVVELFENRAQLSDGYWYFNSWLTAASDVALPTPPPALTPLGVAAEEIQLIMDQINLTYGPEHSVRFFLRAGGMMARRNASDLIIDISRHTRERICNAHTAGNLQIQYLTRART